MVAKRILAVEDAPATQRLLCDVLAGEGHEVLVAPDGPSALAALAEHPFDLVILDVILPGMTGFQVLQKLRRRRETALLPVVMLTSVALHPDVFDAWMCNADFYLTKPFEVAALVSAVTRLLARDDARSAVTAGTTGARVREQSADTEMPAAHWAGLPAAKEPVS